MSRNLTSGHEGGRLVRPMSGFSGAAVQLMTTDDEHWFVRKVATDSAASARLEIQMHRQARFSETIPVVRVPRILNHGMIDDRFYFDMEFVRGRDGVTFLRQANYEQLAGFVERLCGYFKAAARTAARAVLGTSLRSKPCLPGSRMCRTEPGFSTQRHCRRLFMALDVLREGTHGLTPTFCHGDLTLENMLITEGGELWMIDCLDAPFEHYWQDVAKVHQDLEGAWYSRNHQLIPRFVLDHVSQRILTTVRGLDDSYDTVHPLLMAMAFVRILPYVRTMEDRDFVIETHRPLCDCLHRERLAMKVLVPCCGRSSRYPNQPPKWMLPAHDGRPMLTQTLAQIPFAKEDVMVTILRDHEEQYAVTAGLRTAFGFPVTTVVLDKPTSSQPETVVRTIEGSGWRGRFMVKDSDNTFALSECRPTRTSCASTR